MAKVIVIRSTIVIFNLNEIVHTIAMCLGYVVGLDHFIKKNSHHFYLFRLLENASYLIVSSRILFRLRFNTADTVIQAIIIASSMITLATSRINMIWAKRLAGVMSNH